MRLKNFYPGIRHFFTGKIHRHEEVASNFRMMFCRYKTTVSSATLWNESSDIMKKTNDRVCTHQYDDEMATTTLKEIPMLPYVGSLIPFYSKTPPLTSESFRDFFVEVRRRYGNFYKIGFPGFGKGIYGEAYILNDPNEMMKVFRQQERTSNLPYPRGGIQSTWPLIKHLKQTESVLSIGTIKHNQDNVMTFDNDGFFGRGETWKRLRSFLQTDMLSPQAARGYIPGMVQAAQIASASVPASACSLNAYTNRCAFDLFNSLMFGELTKTADLKSAEKINVQYCNDAVEALSTMVTIMMSPYENVLGQALGIKTSNYKAMSAAFTRLFDTSESKYNAFRTRYENEPDQLTELEKNSYIARAIDRQKESSNISEDDLREIIKLMLSVAIDTTSSPMSWNIYHIAVNQDAQERLFNELSHALSEERSTSGNECITENVLKRSMCPYLHAIIRESHRLTPNFQIGIAKNSIEDLEIHGVMIPKDSIFIFDSFSIGIDPKYVDDPMEFKPERWLDDAIERRKGTPSEIIDHPFFEKPFSQGSRKCPGSRVASNEIAILLSQLVLDWKISAPPHIKSVKDMEHSMTGNIVPKLPKLNFTSRS